MYSNANAKCKCNVLISFLEYIWEFMMSNSDAYRQLTFYSAIHARHVIKLSKLQKYVFQYYKV